MAELVHTSAKYDVAGSRGKWIVELPAVSDADTFDVKKLGGIRHVDSATVVHTGGDAVAADSITVASVTADTLVTFQVAGTARTAKLTVEGH